MNDWLLYLILILILVLDFMVFDLIKTVDRLEKTIINETYIAVNGHRGDHHVFSIKDKRFLYTSKDSDLIKDLTNALNKEYRNGI